MSEGPEQLAEPRRWQAAKARVQRALVGRAPNERQRLFALTLVIGGVCGLAAVSFHSAIRLAEHLLIDRALAAPGYSWITWTLLTATCGALLSGALLHYLPEARGSGIPQVKLAFAVKGGRLRLRDAAGKFVIAVLQIGSGSALGREGPTVQICAGLASALGRMFSISPRNLRRMIPVGAAAGIAAAFNAPIAAVTFTIEEIIGDLDQTLLSGVVVAAALAAVIERSVLGEHPVFHVPGQYALEHASSLLIYAALGAAAALASWLFYTALLGLRSWFRAWRWGQAWARPGVGGLVTGALAVVCSLAFGVGGVNGDGYSTLSAALAGTLALHVMLALAAFKLITTVFCYSSGGAGGIFAPVLFIGGMLGGSFGQLDRFLLSHIDTDLGAFALVGMGAFFAAVIRAPITSVLIIFEMTRGYGLVLPLMIANTAAYMLARQLHPVPIYEALLDQDGLQLPQTQRAAAALSALSVADAMTSDVVKLQGQTSIAQALELLAGHHFSMYPVVDENGFVSGVVNEAQLRRLLAEGHGAETLATHGRAEELLHAETPLVEAVVRMSELRARQMAVIASQNAPYLVGVLAMSDVMRAHAIAAGASDHTDAGEPRARLRPAVAWTRRDSKISSEEPRS